MKRISIPSGSYVTSHSKREILDAFLGTCVGVTLIDHAANVGGLIHLLLPEPTTKDYWQPENYASTGLPIFIKTLYKAGASRSRLRACIAGGALVGPLDKRDLFLDIGGRNVEIAEKVLNREGIAVSRSETGGYFSCRLSLDLNTWESHIEPIRIPADSDATELKKPTPQEISTAIERVLPIPQIALKVIRMIRDDRHNMEDMAREIRRDQIISAKVMRLCNSAFFGFKSKIDSIDRALVILGEKLLLQVVVAASLEDYFSQIGTGYSLCKGGLYNHALGTAMITEKLTRFTGNIFPDVAYTAGLMHDIGKVVLDQFVAPVYPFFYRKTQMEGVDLIEVEREAFDVTHNEIGSQLAKLWNLPDGLADTIMHHHNPEQSSVSSELTHLVYLADLLMSRFMVGQELDRLNTHALESRLDKVGLTTEQFPMIIDTIPRQVFESSFTHFMN